MTDFLIMFLHSQLLYQNHTFNFKSLKSIVYSQVRVNTPLASYTLEADTTLYCSYPSCSFQRQLQIWNMSWTSTHNRHTFPCHREPLFCSEWCYLLVDREWHINNWCHLIWFHWNLNLCLEWSRLISEFLEAVVAHIHLPPILHHRSHRYPHCTSPQGALNGQWRIVAMWTLCLVKLQMQYKRSVKLLFYQFNPPFPHRFWNICSRQLL